MNGNFSPEQLFKMSELLKNKGMSEADRKKHLTEFAVKNMNSSQTEQLRKLLGDADAVKDLMNSDKAREIMQRLKNQK